MFLWENSRKRARMDLSLSWRSGDVWCLGADGLTRTGLAIFLTACFGQLFSCKIQGNSFFSRCLNW